MLGNKGEKAWRVIDGSRSLRLLFEYSPRKFGTIVAYEMHTEPVPCIPMAWAAPRLRSRATPDTNGPRSLMTTVTDLPVLGFVTVSRVPNGRVRWAAVIPWGSNRCPLAVRWPCE